MNLIFAVLVCRAVCLIWFLTAVKGVTIIFDGLAKEKAIHLAEGTSVGGGYKHESTHIPAHPVIEGSIIN